MISKDHRKKKALLMNCLFSKEKALVSLGWRWKKDMEHKNKWSQKTGLARTPHQLSSSNIWEPRAPQITSSQTCTQHHEQSISKQRVRWRQGWIYLPAASKRAWEEGPEYQASRRGQSVIAQQAGRELSLSTSSTSIRASVPPLAQLGLLWAVGSDHHLTTPKILS